MQETDTRIQTEGVSMRPSGFWCICWSVVLSIVLGVYGYGGGGSSSGGNGGDDGGGEGAGAIPKVDLNRAEFAQYPGTFFSMAGGV